MTDNAWWMEWRGFFYALGVGLALATGFLLYPHIPAPLLQVGFVIGLALMTVPVIGLLLSRKTSGEWTPMRWRQAFREAHGELRADNRITHAGIQRIEGTLDRVQDRIIETAAPLYVVPMVPPPRPHVSYQVDHGPAANASAPDLFRTAWRLLVRNDGSGAGRYTVSINVQEPKGGRTLQYEAGSHYLPWKHHSTRTVEILAGQSDVLDVGFLEHDADGVLRGAGLWFRYDGQPLQCCWFALAGENPGNLRAEFTVTVSTEPAMGFGPSLTLPFYIDRSGMDQIKPKVHLVAGEPDYFAELQQALLASNPFESVDKKRQEPPTDA
jgi:hypothetical protein